MNIIGLGKAGCKIAELFKEYPQYTVFKMDSDKKLKRKKNCFYIPQQGSAELYDANPVKIRLKAQPVPRRFIKQTDLDRTFIHFGYGSGGDETTNSLVDPSKLVIKRAAEPYPHFGLINPVIADLCDAMDTMKTAPKVNLNAVILQSELDKLVPVDFQNEMLQRYGGPLRKVLMKGIDHDGLLTEHHEPAIYDSIRWLWKHTSQPKSLSRGSDNSQQA